MQGSPPATFWETLSEFPLFVVQLFVNPRSLVRGSDWSDGTQLRRLCLYTFISLAILVIAFDTNRRLAEVERPALSNFKGVVMRAHDRSWDWLGPVYGTFNLEQGEAKRLWDTLLTTGFLSYTMLAALIAVALLARLRMLRFGIGWNQALGTGLLGLIPCAACVALSLVPLFLLLICRHCVVRASLFVLLNLLGWAYLGYYALGDLGERPAGARVLLKSLVYGMLLYLLAYTIFLVLVAVVIPV
jgi:hypothetical protein